MFERSIHRLQGGSVLAECGPMRLVISAFVGKLPQPDLAVRAGYESFAVLEHVAREKPRLGWGFRSSGSTGADGLAARMIESVAAVGDEDLTPMAAVAGTIADSVAEFLFERGMTKVIVGNGGDISIRLQAAESVTVGIRPEVGSGELSHVLSLGPERRSWGVATSGLAGRSLTRGVASAVTVVAKTASLADAAATAVANASFIKDVRVVQRPAEEVDAYTDIPGIPVTVKVGPLSETVKSLAVERAIERARELIAGKIILGAFVAVQGRIGMTQFIRDSLIEVD